MQRVYIYIYRSKQVIKTSVNSVYKERVLHYGLMSLRNLPLILANTVTIQTVMTE